MLRVPAQLTAAYEPSEAPAVSSAGPGGSRISAVTASPYQSTSASR